MELFGALETRLCLAGNVAVLLEGSILVIRGDDASNQLVISTAMIDVDRFATEVVGVNGTTINSVSQRGGTRFNTVRGIRAELGSGDDVITLTGRSLRGSVIFDGGSGDDELLIRNARIGGKLELRGGRGSDSIAVRNTRVAGQFFIPQTRGDDAVSLRASHFGDDALIGDKLGQSTFSARQIVVDGQLKITTGQSADILTITDSVVYGTSAFKTGDGDDVVRIVGSEFKQATSLDDGAGEDQVYREVIRRFDFDAGKQGWRANFSNYPAGQVIGTDASGNPQNAEVAFRLESGIGAIPLQRADQRRAFRLAGFNGTDSMLFSIARAFSADDGASPNTAYTVKVSFRYFSPAQELSRTLAVAALPGLVQTAFVTQEFSPRSSLVLLGSDGVSSIQRSGELIAAAPLSQGLVEVAQVLPYVVSMHPDVGELSVLIALDNRFEDYAQIYFEEVKVELVPDAQVSRERMVRLQSPIPMNW